MYVQKECRLSTYSVSHQQILHHKIGHHRLKRRRKLIRSQLSYVTNGNKGYDELLRVGWIQAFVKWLNIRKLVKVNESGHSPIYKHCTVAML